MQGIKTNCEYFQVLPVEGAVDWYPQLQNRLQTQFSSMNLPQKWVPWGSLRVDSDSFTQLVKLKGDF
jgi:hypothetical protein